MENDKLSLFFNAPFELEFGGKVYTVRAANILDAVLYQKRLQELVEAKSPAIDLELAVYCLYLVLKKVDPTITEDYVKENCPANIDTLSIIEKLGFMSPQKRANMLLMRDITTKQQ